MLERLTTKTNHNKYDYASKGVEYIGNIIDKYGKIEDLLEEFGFKNIDQLEVFLRSNIEG